MSTKSLILHLILHLILCTVYVLLVLALNCLLRWFKSHHHKAARGEK
jgi:uncharacterized protein YggT (Ycf19 family)